MLDNERVIDNIINNLNEGLWWRLFDLKGMTLRLKKPLSTYIYPNFDGDRNYIKIFGYDKFNPRSKYNKATGPGAGHRHMFELYEINDWVLFGNEETPRSRELIISLSLLDYDYFVEQINNNV